MVSHGTQLSIKSMEDVTFSLSADKTLPHIKTSEKNKLENYGNPSWSTYNYKIILSDVDSKISLHGNFHIFYFINWTSTNVFPSIWVFFFLGYFYISNSFGCHFYYIFDDQRYCCIDYLISKWLIILTNLLSTFIVN